MLDLMLIAAACYSGVAIIIFALTLAAGYDRNLEGLALALAWPFVFCMAPFWVVYRMLVQSVATIRQDLRNRGMLKDFNKWYDSRQKTEKNYLVMYVLDGPAQTKEVYTVEPPYSLSAEDWMALAEPEDFTRGETSFELIGVIRGPIEYIV